MDYVEIVKQLAIIASVAYLVGSIPTGYIVVKLFTGQDIRTIGSGSTGATNVKRVMGKKWFFTVMILDAIKGVIPVLLASYFGTVFTHSGLLAVVAAVCAILGHSRSIFLGFTGGKSVATGVGTLLALSWQTGLLIAIIWASITWITRYVSVGSMIALAFAPVFMWILNAPPAYTVYAIIAAIYVIYLHRENIKRLQNGEENKIRE
ncbi:glycerol-3-phosphate 1-O-acyltransferase PlsY [bacterium]|nr:glycerol-3-phosphate 1-O-acyltransferase PlsY [bacterium]